MLNALRSSSVRNVLVYSAIHINHGRYALHLRDAWDLRRMPSIAGDLLQRWAEISNIWTVGLFLRGILQNTIELYYRGRPGIIIRADLLLSWATLNYSCRPVTIVGDLVLL